MALRCLLFSSDEGTAEPILQVLAGLDVEGELCSEAVTAVEKVSHQNFQIVIIDWDKQPEAALLLTSARERKANARPLTLAIVSDDLSVPKALQAGANSILRKPLLVNQIKDTLTTARDLLRAKQESASNAQAAAAGISATGAGPAAVPISALPANLEQGKEKNLRAGEFLQFAPSAPGGQFVTDSEVNEFRVSSSMEKDLEPVAASVEEEEKRAPPPPETGEVRGLEWYLKTRAGIMPQGPASAAAQASAHASAHVSTHASTTPAPAKPELLGYDQTPSFSPTPAANAASSRFAAATPQDSEGSFASEAHSNPSGIPVQSDEQSNEQNHEQKKEAELFAYITRGSGESVESENSPRPRFRFKGAIVGALALASCAIAAAPQAPWHASMQTAWARGRLNLHAWLNPQPVTTPQAPIAHEDFSRAGDEYKLPVTENIPDATTDASQIQVVPAVEPTAPKPNIMGGNVMPPGTVEAGSATPTDPTAASGVPVAGNQPQLPPVAAQLSNGSSTSGTSSALGSPASASPALSTQGSTSPVSTPPPGPAPAAPSAAPATHSDPPTVFPSATSASSATSGSAQPTPQKPQQQYVPPSAPANVPSSLKSQMASTMPEASGNRPAESAMQSIEPVKVDEAAERALLTDQPAPDYPASSSGQPGMVVLQVLIGRDGTVQDAKFLQGSLGFARAAIDGVKRWKFKPYTMNGRPVSVQTSLTISFKPAS
jgi:protein TonB